jgi:TPR repeat protein
MVTGTTQGERRRKSRKRPLRLIYVELAAANGGMMRDLSDDGFAIRAMIPVRAGEKTPFSFSLDKYTRIEGQGQILWVQDSGHVAGVRFQDIDASARESIREWLLHGDKPETREAPVESDSLTMEQLREEMQSVPPRPEGKLPIGPSENGAAKVAGSEPAQEIAPLEAVKEQVVHEAESSVPEAAEEKEPEDVPSAPAVAPASISENVLSAPPSAPPVHAGETTPTPDTSRASTNPFERPDAPALPRLSLTPKTTDSQSQPVAATLPPVAERPAATESHWKPIPLVPPSEQQSRQPELQALPDISAVLMQPHAPAQAATHVAPVEALPPWEPRPTERWADRISLSGVVTLMTTLAMLAGLYVFHKEVGTGLIWLGQSLGGVSQGQAPLLIPSSSDTTKTPETAPQTYSAEPAPAGNTGGLNNATSNNTNPSPSDSNATNSSAPPVANNSSPASSAPDNGQAEYTQATQILRVKNPSLTPDALRLLWISVEKGNAGAELQLAEMYWHGQGVIQNCDQAHILLTAAARKGNVEATKQLIAFQKIGCK